MRAAKDRDVLVVRMKHWTAFIDATDPERAFLAAFKHIDDEEYYNDIKDTASKPTPDITPEVMASNDPDRVAQRERLLKRHQRELAEWEEMRALYAKAKAGDGKAARRLMGLREAYEYEEWQLETLEVP